MLRTSRERVGRKKLKIISLIFITLAFFLPTFYGSSIRGVQLITLGWIAFAAKNWLLGFCWLGTLFLFVSLLLSPGKKRWRVYLASISFILTLIMAFVGKIPTNDTGEFVSIAPGFGYIAWTLGSGGILLYHLERLNPRRRR